jgi:hypothetical protein
MGLTAQRDVMAKLESAYVAVLASHMRLGRLATAFCSLLCQLTVDLAVLWASGGGVFRVVEDCSKHPMKDDQQLPARAGFTRTFRRKARDGVGHFRTTLKMPVTNLS